MAVGDLTLSSGFTLTPEDLRAIAAESKKILAEESKDLSQFKEIDSVSSVSSLPGISAKGELVRVPMAILKGIDGKEIELASSSTAIQWRYVGNTGWNVLVKLSLLLGPKGDPGDPPIISIGTVSTLPFNSSATARLVLEGETPEGTPIYALDLGIPQGRPGQDGNGAGNVFVSTDNIIADKYYIFKSSADKSANGDFIELEDLTFGVGESYPGYKNAEIFNDYENNKAAGAYAHAEGMNTNATGPRSHAEGHKTNVFAADAHAEGRETWCVGPQGHVEGSYSICLGGNSHVEGTAFQEGSTGEGVRPVLLNDEEAIRTFVETFGTDNQNNYDDTFLIRFEQLYKDYCVHIALGERSHAEGANNFVGDNTSHVEGYNNICGDLYFAHGAPQVHKANHVEGANNILYSGNKPSSQNFCVHIEGETNIVYGGCSYSHIGGKDCKVGDPYQEGITSHYSFGHGLGIVLKNDYSTSFGRYNLYEIEGKNVLFSYGIGYNGRRDNALSILEDGTVVIPRLNSIQPLINKVNNIYKELKGIIDEQSKQIQDLLALIPLVKVKNDILMIGTPKAFVIGSLLVLTKNLPAGVFDDTIMIADASVMVENDILTIK